MAQEPAATELVRRPGDEPGAHVARNVIRSPADLARMAQAMGASHVFPNIRNTDQALVVLAWCMEMGMPPVSSAGSVHFVKGRPMLGGPLVAAMLRRHPLYDYRVREATEERATIEITRGGQVEGRSSFTIEEAKRAGLVRPDSGWTTYPGDMLVWRALTRGARRYAPDVFVGGIYVEGEIEDSPPGRPPPPAPRPEPPPEPPEGPQEPPGPPTGPVQGQVVNGPPEPDQEAADAAWEEAGWEARKRGTQETLG